MVLDKALNPYLLQQKLGLDGRAAGKKISSYAFKGARTQIPLFHFHLFCQIVFDKKGGGWKRGIWVLTLLCKNGLKTTFLGPSDIVFEISSKRKKWVIDLAHFQQVFFASLLYNELLFFDFIYSFFTLKTRLRGFKKVSNQKRLCR